MNNSSISTLYRNVLAILNIHLYYYFKASVPVASGSVQQLNKSRTTAACPGKPADLINNVCLWQPNWHSHHASTVWSRVHKSCWMCSLLNSGCWSLQGELQPQLVTRFLRLQPLLTCRNLSKTFPPPQLWPAGLLFRFPRDISLFVPHWTGMATSLLSVSLWAASEHSQTRSPPAIE